MVKAGTTFAVLNVVLEGGFIMSKVLDEAQSLVRYLRVLRSFLETAFGVAVTPGAPAGGQVLRSGSGPDRPHVYDHGPSRPRAA